MDVQTNWVVKEEDRAGRVKCEICFDEYPVNDLEQHREMCMVRLMFRCTVCYEDYVSKEGLWNHLDLHEIADESKEFHYQELRAPHKLHICTLCNDQRGYQEKPYWKHVHDVHKGFFLRCSECGESFRSQKLKTDHDLNHCKARKQTAPLHAGDLEVDSNLELEPSLQVQKTASLVSDGEINETAGAHLELSRRERRNELNEENNIHAHNVDSLLSDDPLASLNVAVDVRHNMPKNEFEMPSNTSSNDRSPTEHNMHSPSGGSSVKMCSQCGKEFSNNIFLASHIQLNHKSLVCKICGKTSLNSYQARYHKMTKHTEPKHKCPHCPRAFHRKKDYDHHFPRCEERKFSCELCGQKFKALLFVVQHMKRFHHNKGEEQEQNQVEQIVQNKAISLEETSLLQPLVKNPSSETSGTKCSQCGQKFSDDISLANHIESNHMECDICGIKFSSFSRVQYHRLMKHTERKYKCPHCPRTYHRPNEYQTHLGKCETKKFSCELCHDKFKTLQYVAMHMKRFHQVKGSLKKIQIDSLDSNVKQEQEETTLLRDPASRDHKTVHSQLSEYVPSNKNYVDGTDNKITKKETNRMKDKSVTTAAAGKNKQPIVENSSSESSETKCSYCGKESASVKALYWHINSCHKPTKCNICGMSFSTAGKARHHKAIKHSDLKYECGICSKKFRQEKVYKFHLTICDGTKFPCKLCDHKFRSSYSLKVHVRRQHRDKEESMKDQIDLPSCEKQQELKHTENIDFKTEIKVEETTLLQQDSFERSTVNRSTITECLDQLQYAKDHEAVDAKPLVQEISDSPLNEHPPDLINAANDTDSVPSLKDRTESEIVAENPSSGASCTKCSQCGTQLSSVVSLARHIESCHVPVPCDICGITLSSVSKARYHKNTMHTEPKHKCPHCSKKFHREYIYREHVSFCVTRKFPCDLCGKRFRKLYWVKYHKRRVHYANDALGKVQRIDSENLLVESSGQTSTLNQGKKSDIHEEIDSFSNQVNLTSLKNHPEQKQSEQMPIKMEITVEETTLLQYDDFGVSTPTPSTTAARPHLSYHIQNQEVAKSETLSVNCGEHSLVLTPERMIDTKHVLTSFDQQIVDSRWNEHSRVSFNGPDDTDNITDALPLTSLEGSCETAVVAEKNVQKPSRGSSEKKCSHCGKKFSNATALTRHIGKNHRARTCDVCGMAFPSFLKVKYHKITRHTEPSFKCPHCPKKFHHDYSYRRHLSTCEQKKQSCKLCDQQFRNIKQVATHMKRDHQVNGTLKNVHIDRIADNEGQVQNQAITINCPICSETFGDQNQVSRHVEAIHQKTMCTSCGMTFASADQREDHKRTCSKHLQHMDLLSKTETISLPHGDESSSGSSNTVCPQCDKDYYDKAFLARHIVNCHQPVACDICGVVVTGKNQLRYHKLHKDCRAMGYQTDRNDKNELEEEPQPCGDMHTSQGEDIDLKMEIKVEDSTIQEQECPAQDKDREKSPTITIISASQLIGRKKKIPKFTCNKCHQSFHGVRDFQRHIQTHTKGGKFRCKICYLQLKNRRILQSHMMTEHNSGMISAGMKCKCLCCGASFSNINKLRYHKIKFHPEQKVQKVRSEDVDHEGEIKIKDERLDDETLMTLQSSTESSEHHETFSNRNVSHVRHAADDQKETCSICGAAFGNRRKLEYHELLSHTEPKYKCSHCSLTFHLKYLQRRHEKVHSKTKKEEHKASRVVCKLCSKTFSDKWVLRRHHKIFHPHTELLCNKCNIKFASHQKFNSHMKRFHTEPRFKCPHCGKLYCIQYAFRKHMAVCLRVKRKRMRMNEEMSKQLDDGNLAQNRNSSLQSVDSEQIDHENEIKIKEECLEDNDPSEACPICGLTFENRHRLEYHKLVIHTAPQHKCSHCPKVFHVTAMLRRHEKSHSRNLEVEGSVVCNLCHIRFPDEAGLQRHIVNVHPPSAMSCDKCDLKFTNRHKLHYHVKKIHTVPGFKCPDCGKICNFQYVLRRHMAVHLKAKQESLKERTKISELRIDDALEQNQNLTLQNVESERLDHENEIEINEDQSEACSICGVIIFGNMKYHKDTAHTEPKHKCSYCPKIFHSFSKLTRHEATHSKNLEGDVVCKLCPKTFQDEHGLQCHINLAHPSSELSCSMCDLKFSTQSKLSYHEKTIHKTRFKCPECDEPFHAQHALRNHMAVHSKAKGEEHSLPK